MALYYLDTSALVKLYVREPGTERLLRLARPASNHQFAVLALAPVEFRSAIRRRERAGDIEPSAATELLERFARHIESRFLRQSLTEPVLETALRLIDQYPLRAYDAIQLGGCLVLGVAGGKERPVFVCADSGLLEAAESEGLSSFDPSA